MKKRYDKALSPEEIAALYDKDIDVSDIPPLGKEFWDNFKQLFEGQEKQLGFIDQIIAGIKRKKPIIRNYVRTACPAGGTILASDRLVLYLKVIFNAIGLIPAVKAFPPYGHLKGLIIAIVQQSM